jgi:hypothetical protein
MIVCQNAHHGVGHSLEGIHFACQFSFQLDDEDLSRERRMEYLNLLFESMTDRVDSYYEKASSAKTEEAEEEDG